MASGSLREVARLGAPLLRRHRRWLPLTIGLGVAASLVEGIGITLFIPLLDPVVGGRDLGEGVIQRALASVFGDLPQDARITAVCLSILGAVLLRAALSFASAAIWARLYTALSHGLRTRAHDQLLRARYGWLVRTDEGRLLNALSNETWNATDAVTTLVRMAVTASMIAVYVVLLALLSWRLTILVSVAVVAISLVVRSVTRRVTTMSVRLTAANTTLADRMLDSCERSKVIRIFGREDHERRRFDAASRRVSGLLRDLELVKSGTGPLYDVLAAAVLVGVLFVSLRSNPGRIGELVVFALILYRLQPRVRQLDAQRVTVLSLVGGVRETAWLLDGGPDRAVVDGRLDASELRPALDVDSVTFAYDGVTTPVLHDVTFRIRAGETTAIVGPSGSGKSTLVDLLLRLHDPMSGRIALDGVPLPDLTLASLRERIAVVSQDAQLFNVSVRENIAYARDGLDDGAVGEAARIAQAHQFIAALPDGFDTIVGGDGVRLSGGQRQRLALARAIARRADILVLDEATNALDSITETAVIDALAAVPWTVTTVIVAHRLSTIRRADHVVVLEGGRVVEQGPPEALLADEGLFAMLSELQAVRA
jgi:subfamily B ATP-binding cassette protein MsbA